MANTTYGGFRFVKMRNGSKTPVVEVFPVANNYGTGIFRGDPVKRQTDGTIVIAAAGDTNILGIADGVDFYMSSGVPRKGNYLPANTTFTPTTVGSWQQSMVRVILARDAIFEVDADDGSSVTSLATAQAVVGENCDHVATSAGSTTTGRSGYCLNISDHSTNTFQWRIVGISSDPLNDVTSTNWKLLVEVNEASDPQFSTTGD